MLTLASGGGTGGGEHCRNGLYGGGSSPATGTLTKTGNGIARLEQRREQQFQRQHCRRCRDARPPAGFSAASPALLDWTDSLGASSTVNNGAHARYTVNNIFGNGVGNSDVPCDHPHWIGRLPRRATTSSATLRSTGGTLTQASTETDVNYEGFQFLGDVTWEAVRLHHFDNYGKADHLGPNDLRCRGCHQAVWRPT
jgi:hypothetical protein